MAELGCLNNPNPSGNFRTVSGVREVWFCVQGNKAVSYGVQIGLTA